MFVLTLGFLVGCDLWCALVLGLLFCFACCDLVLMRSSFGVLRVGWFEYSKVLRH